MSTGFFRWRVYPVLPMRSAELVGAFRATLAPSSAARANVSFALGLVALVALAVTFASTCTESTHKSLCSPPMPRVVSYRGRAPRFLHSRIQHDVRSTSTWNATRVIISGDVELNPSPADVQAAPSAGADRKRRAEPLTCLAQNMRSLNNKFGSLRALSPVLRRFDIIVLTETWLKPHVSDSELSSVFDGHVWLRHDREGGVAGGGVACALRASLLSVRQSELESGEMILVDLTAYCPVVTVIAAYRPPDNGVAVKNIVSVMKAVCATEHPVFMVGNFNLPEIDWRRPCEHPVLLRRSARAVTLVDATAQCGLQQHVLQPTRGDNVLDLVLTNLAAHAVKLMKKCLTRTIVTLLSRVSCPGCPLPVSPDPLS